MTTSSERPNFRMFTQITAVSINLTERIFKKNATQKHALSLSVQLHTPFLCSLFPLSSCFCFSQSYTSDISLSIFYSLYTLFMGFPSSLSLSPTPCPPTSGLKWSFLNSVAFGGKTFFSTTSAQLHCPPHLNALLSPTCPFILRLLFPTYRSRGTPTATFNMYF